MIMVRLSTTARRVTRAALIAVAIAVALLPAAALWGVRNAGTEDYLGPHRTSFRADYSGEITLDLGPLGQAYLPNRFVPVPLRFLGLDVRVEGVAGTQGSSTRLFSESTLQAYVEVYSAPRDVLRGPLEKLAQDAAAETIRAELVLLGVTLLWLVRRRWLTPRVAAALRPRWMAVGYIVLLAVVTGSVVGPPRPVPTRTPVPVTAGTSFADLTVDNPLLAAVLNQGIGGLQLLAERQQTAVDDYIRTSTDSFIRQLDRVAMPADGEVVTLAYSDLHCSIAMTEAIGQLVTVVNPRLLLSSGDNTVNGTAAERACVARERGMAGERTQIVSTGNHDSETTDEQMRALEFTVLDGQVVGRDGVTYLGDDDPEHNVPFSVARTMERNETEEQLGNRLREAAVAAGGVDVIAVHQPTAAAAIAAIPDPPTKLLLWGHMHAQLGPTVIPRADGSWTVALQAGTAGGIKQPTLTEFSTPYTPPRTRADVYLIFTDVGTGLVTGVQPVHYLPSGEVVVDDRITTGDPASLPLETRDRMARGKPSPSATG